MATRTPAPETFVLYYYPQSICSIMVRLCFAFRGQAAPDKPDLRLEGQIVDIFKGEQLSEHYMRNISSKGTVPVLVPRDGDQTAPMADTLEITYRFADSYPDLLPATHEDEIKSLLQELHQISFFSLTFAGRPEGAQSDRYALEESLKSDDVRGEYRALIEKKIERIDTIRLPALTDKSINMNIERTNEFMSKIEKILEKPGTLWCFGLTRPSALDAHLVAFVARLIDIDRGELVPRVVKQLADEVMAGPEWHSIMQGQTTRPF